MKKKILNTLVVVLSCVFTMTTAYSQDEKESAVPLTAIGMTDKLETSIGDLDFFDGVPSDATIDKLYDNLDRMRAIQVFLE